MKDCEVLTTGTFNCTHAGHIELLEFAAKYGKVTVGINADPYLKEKYGDAAVPLVDRAAVLSAIVYVDNVVIFREKTPAELIRRLKPKFFIKGPDYRPDTGSLPELPAIQDVGARLIIHPAEKRYSSTQLAPTLPQNRLMEKVKKYI